MCPANITNLLDCAFKTLNLRPYCHLLAPTSYIAKKGISHIKGDCLLAWNDITSDLEVGG
jgi:hypothetical protein